jgi:hypothetical protein
MYHVQDIESHDGKAVCTARLTTHQCHATRLAWSHRNGSTSIECRRYLRILHVETLGRLVPAGLSWAFSGSDSEGQCIAKIFFTNGTAEHGHCPVFDSLGNAVVTFAMQVEEKVRQGSEVRFRQIGELV